MLLCDFGVMWSFIDNISLHNYLINHWNYATEVMCYYGIRPATYCLILPNLQHILILYKGTREHDVKLGNKG